MPSRRPRENRTRYVVLGILTMGPTTGYGIRQRIARSVGHFWQESFGQLYPTLQALVAEGLVRPRDARPRGRHGAIYEVTARGREALAAWLARPPVPSPPRDELMLKVFFGGAVAPEVTARTIAAAAAAVRDEAARLQAVADGWEAAVGDHPDAPYRRLTLDFGLGVMRFVARWAEEAERVVAAAAPRSRSRRRAAGAGERGAAR